MLIGYTPKLGAIIQLIPAIHIDTNGLTDTRPIPAKIVRINWKHRYFTAEFKYPHGGSFRESFKFAEEGDLACLIMV